MMTVFGPVKFVAYDKMTNQNKLPTYLVQWIDGKLELVWPKEVASKPFHVSNRLGKDVEITGKNRHAWLWRETILASPGACPT